MTLIYHLDDVFSILVTLLVPVDDFLQRRNICLTVWQQSCTQCLCYLLLEHI